MSHGVEVASILPIAELLHGCSEFTERSRARPGKKVFLYGFGGFGSFFFLFVLAAWALRQRDNALVVKLAEVVLENVLALGGQSHRGLQSCEGGAAS